MKSDVKEFSLAANVAVIFIAILFFLNSSSLTFAMEGFSGGGGFSTGSMNGSPDVGATTGGLGGNSNAGAGIASGGTTGNAAGLGNTGSAPGPSAADMTALNDIMSALQGLIEAAKSSNLGDGTELGGSIGGHGGSSGTSAEGSSSGSDQSGGNGGGNEFGNQQNYASCPNLYGQLAQGMNDASTGGQVSALQGFLRSYYGVSPEVLSGGFFGNITRQYVLRFQQEQSLSVIGEVGPQTRARIAQLCAQGQGAGQSGTRSAQTYVNAGECANFEDDRSCNTPIDWNAPGVSAVHINLVPPGGAEYNWSRLYFGYPNGSPSSLQTRIDGFTISGVWQIKMYEAGTSRLLGTDTIQVGAVTANTQTQTQTQTPAPIRTQTDALTIALPTGTLSARGCTVGTDRSQFYPNNALTCDSSVTWTTNNARSAYVVIGGDAPYDITSFPHGAAAGNNTRGTNVKFWTKEGSYTAKLYVDGVPPTQTTAGTGRLVETKTFTVRSKTQATNPVAPGAASGGSLTLTKCTPGLGKSTIDPSNPLICDVTATWSTENADNAYVVIAGDTPYTSASFPNGYVAGSTEIGTAGFWVTGGTYTAKLYVNGTAPTNSSAGTGTLVDTENFTITIPVTSYLGTLNQMASVLRGLQDLLKNVR